MVKPCLKSLPWFSQRFLYKNHLAFFCGEFSHCCLAMLPLIFLFFALNCHNHIIQFVGASQVVAAQHQVQRWGTCKVFDFTGNAFLLQAVNPTTSSWSGQGSHCRLLPVLWLVGSCSCLMLLHVYTHQCE